MKKAIILFITCCLFISNAFSQSSDLDMRYGAEFNPQGTINAFIGQIGNTIFVQSYRKGIILGGVDATTLSQSFENEVSLPLYNGKEVNFKRIDVIEDELIMFCTYYDKKADKNYLFAQRVSQSGKLQGDLITLDEMTAEKKNNRGAFDISIEDDGKRILLFRNPPFEKYGKEKFAFKLLDKNLKEIWSNEELELPYPDRYFSLGDFFIDNNDMLYVTATFDDFRATKESDGRKKAKEEAEARGGSYFSYKIISYNPKDKKVKDYAVELDNNNKIVNLGYNVDVNGDINICGLYGNEDSRGSAIGLFFTKINHESRKTDRLSLKPFDKDWIEDYLGLFLSDKKAAKRVDKGEGIRHLSLDSFINREDGGLVVIGEIYNVYTVCTTDSKGVTRCSTHYVYGTIFVINVTNSGNIDWFATVPKLQHTVNDGGFYSSYAMVNSENSFYFIYNDNIKNYDPKKKDKKLYNMAGVKKSGTTIAKVTADGKVTKELNLKMQSEKMMLRPKVSQDLTKDKMVILAKYGKKERVMEVKLK
ncbi:MAG: hypothetical protein IPP69_10255 [Flavobacteriales bacterium]|nr:hypothetical protein [Flavobacteriales bacterium]